MSFLGIRVQLILLCFLFFIPSGNAKEGRKKGKDLNHMNLPIVLNEVTFKASKNGKVIFFTNNCDSMHHETLVFKVDDKDFRDNVFVASFSNGVRPGQFPKLDKIGLMGTDGEGKIDIKRVSGSLNIKSDSGTTSASGKIEIDGGDLTFFRDVKFENLQRTSARPSDAVWVSLKELLGLNSLNPKPLCE